MGRRVAIGAALVVGLVFLTIPPAVALVLVGIVGVYFALVFDQVLVVLTAFATPRQARSYQGIRYLDRHWIDAAAPDDAEVGMVLVGATDRFTVNLNEFFNRRRRPVYDQLNGPTRAARRPSVHVSVGRGGSSDGRRHASSIDPARARLVDRPERPAAGLR